MRNVEILMATYNGARYLSAQLDSILAQDTECWHLTVSDDGSTDETPKILDDYVCRSPEKITRVFSGQKFGNARDHFFWMMRQCKAEYMHFSDQDDVWHPDKVRLMQQAMEKAEKDYGAETPLLVFTDQTVVDEQLSEIAPSLMVLQKQDPKAVDYRNILFRNVVTGCTAAINRTLAKLADCCTDTENVIMHDWWLACVAAKFGKLIYLDTSTMDYRQHGNNAVGAKNVGSLGYILSKFRDWKRFCGSIAMKKAQAAVFAQSFAPRLSEADRQCLKEYAAKRSAICFKCAFLRWIPHALWKLLFLIKW